MEEKTTNNENLILSAAGSPEELPRDPETGKIDITNISLGKSKRNNDIVPDDIFDKYYRDLPDKVENQSGSWRTVSTGGKIKILGGDPEGDKEVHKAGAEALHATKMQRRTNKEIIDILLTRKAPKEVIERLGLTEDATAIEAVNVAMLQEAFKGNTKAYELLRDTAGEKPTEKIDASLSAMTPEQQKILEDIKAFNSNT